MNPPCFYINLYSGRTEDILSAARKKEDFLCFHFNVAGNEELAVAKGRFELEKRDKVAVGKTVKCYRHRFYFTGFECYFAARKTVGRIASVLNPVARVDLPERKLYLFGTDVFEVERVLVSSVLTDVEHVVEAEHGVSRAAYRDYRADRRSFFHKLVARKLTDSSFRLALHINGAIGPVNFAATGSNVRNGRYLFGCRGYGEFCRRNVTLCSRNVFHDKAFHFAAIVSNGR